MSKLKKLTQQQLFLPIFCMILVLCVNMIYDVSQGRDFYEFFKIGIQNELLSGRLVNILNRGSEVAILAIGMTLVVSSSAGTDISVGSVMALSAGVCCTLLAGAAAPQAGGGLRLRRLQRRPGGLSEHPAHGGHPDSVDGRPCHRPAGVQQPDRLCAQRLCAGIAGVVASSRITSADTNNIGLNFELDAILAVALGGNSLAGGKFNLAGSIIGAYTIQAITTTMYNLGVSSAVNPVFKAVIVIVIVAVQAPPVKAFFKKLSAKRQAGQAEKEVKGAVGV